MPHLNSHFASFSSTSPCPAASGGRPQRGSRKFSAMEREAEETAVMRDLGAYSPVRSLLSLLVSAEWLREDVSRMRRATP